VEDAVAFMREQAGTHFDPDLVRHFLELLPQVLEIRTRFAEPSASPCP
jgi:putative two-component system response regulator